MTEETFDNKIEELAKNIEKDSSIHPLKQKAIIDRLHKAKNAFLRDNKYYTDKEKTRKIENKITTIFGLLFFITLIVYNYGIPGVIEHFSRKIMFISLISFSIAMLKNIIAPGVFWLQQKLFY